MCLIQSLVVHVILIIRKPNLVNGCKPNLVGDDYYCESGIPSTLSDRWQQVLYANDALWDGQQCEGNF